MPRSIAVSSSTVIPALCLLFAAGTALARTPAQGGGAQATGGSPAAAPRNYAMWENEIAAFEAKDKNSPPPKGAVLFVGSSTIRMWKTLAQDFPKHRVINRGFGGSEIRDSTYFAPRIIFPYQPSQIFLRAGGNDINNGRLPEEVAADFAEFVRVVHGKLPNAEIVYIPFCPAPSRWGDNDKLRDLNRRIRRMAVHMPRVTYVDAFDISLTPEGHSRPELFIADGIHLNPDGYKLLVERVRPYLHPAR